MRTPSLAAVAIALVAGACGPGEDPPTALTRPTGAGDVVVQVTLAGGFVPVDVALATVPIVTVLGDGAVITTAPVTAIYPGPAITPLQSVTVPAKTVDELVQRASDLGLLAGTLDFGRPPVADAPDTVVAITADGRTVRHSANALGMEGIGGPQGVSAEAAANRRKLQEFVAATQGLPPGQAGWTPPAVAVYSLGAYQPDPQLTQPARTWPLAKAPTTTGAGFPCTLVEGADAEALLRALAAANARTPWLVNGSSFSLAFRPVVPGADGCPA